MASQTGRTQGHYFKFVIEDSGGVLRDIPVNTINGIGVNYPEVDVSALQDAIQSGLPGQPNYTLEIGGPFDNSAAQAASSSGNVAALSGPHTVLEPLAGAMTPLAFGIYMGIRQPWETGEPCFGITSTATNGILVLNYNVSVDAGLSYSSTLRMYPGSAAPDFATAAFTVS